VSTRIRVDNGHIDEADLKTILYHYGKDAIRPRFVGDAVSFSPDDRLRFELILDGIVRLKAEGIRKKPTILVDGVTWVRMQMEPGVPLLTAGAMVSVSQIEPRRYIDCPRLGAEFVADVEIPFEKYTRLAGGFIRRVIVVTDGVLNQTGFGVVYCETDEYGPETIPTASNRIYKRAAVIEFWSPV
jgi:hypothetical protein